MDGNNFLKDMFQDLGPKWTQHSRPGSTAESSNQQTDQDKLGYFKYKKSQARGHSRDYWNRTSSSTESDTSLTNLPLSRMASKYKNKRKPKVKRLSDHPTTTMMTSTSNSTHKMKRLQQSLSEHQTTTTASNNTHISFASFATTNTSSLKPTPATTSNTKTWFTKPAVPPPPPQPPNTTTTPSSDIYNKSELSSDNRPSSQVKRSLRYRTSITNTSVQDGSGCHDGSPCITNHQQASHPQQQRSSRKSHISTKSRKSNVSTRSVSRSSQEKSHISRRSQASSQEKSHISGRSQASRSSQERSQESTKSQKSRKLKERTMEKSIQTSPPQPSPPPPQPSNKPQQQLMMTSDEIEPSINQQLRDELVMTEDDESEVGGAYDEDDGGAGQYEDAEDFCEISINNTSNFIQLDKSYSEIYNKSERSSDNRPPSKVRRSLKYRTSSPSPNTSVQDGSGGHDDSPCITNHQQASHPQQQRSSRKSHISTKSRKSHVSTRSQVSRSWQEKSHISEKMHKRQATSKRACVTEVKKKVTSDMRSPTRKSRRRTFANLEHDAEVADIRLPRLSTTTRPQRQQQKDAPTEIVVPPMEDDDIVVVAEDGDGVVVVEEDDVALLPPTPKPTKTRGFGGGDGDNFHHIREWLNNPEVPETSETMTDVAADDKTIFVDDAAASHNISIGGYNEPDQPQTQLTRQQLEAAVGLRTSSSAPNTSDNPSISIRQVPVTPSADPAPNIQSPEPVIPIEVTEEEVVADKSRTSTATKNKSRLAKQKKPVIPIEVAEEEVVADKSKTSTATKNKSFAAKRPVIPIEVAEEEVVADKSKASTATKNKSRLAKQKKDAESVKEVVAEKSKTSTAKKNKSRVAKQKKKKPPRTKKAAAKNKRKSERNHYLSDNDDDLKMLDIISPDANGIEAGLRRSKRYRTRQLKPWSQRPVYAEDRTLIGFEDGWVGGGQIRYVNDKRKKLYEDEYDKENGVIAAHQNDDDVTNHQELDPIVEEHGENDLDIQTIQQNDADLVVVDDIQQGEDIEDDENIDIEQLPHIEATPSKEATFNKKATPSKEATFNKKATSNNNSAHLPHIDASPPKQRTDRCGYNLWFQREEDTDQLKSGILFIRPRTRKPTTKVLNWKTRFFVLAGEVELTQQKTSLALTAGCDFSIPPNAMYSLHNHHQQQLAKLVFVSLLVDK